MSKLEASMRLKAKRDTFYLPDPQGGVYFRNNVCSFRIEGQGIDMWIEKLLPMFNGEHTLEMLTAGLPGPYKNRVYEIAEVLHQNGFVRDVSKDKPHQLPANIATAFASQIEFADSLAGSGAARFEEYRQSKVLAIGSGSFLTAAVSSFFQSGLPKLQVIVTDEESTNLERLEKIASHYRQTDPEAELTVATMNANGWREGIMACDAIVYVARENDLENLKLVEQLCKEEGKLFTPAVLLQHTGIAGPVINPDSDTTWESAWRRLHHDAVFKEKPVQPPSSVTEALLVNVAVFELFKTITGINKPDTDSRLFLLDLETIEGNWHPVYPHPLVTGTYGISQIEDMDSLLEKEPDRADLEQMLLRFNLLLSKETGIFHLWEEGDLQQLPLAQCKVRPVDPIASGPAGLLPEQVCSGMTHQEVRKEAALAGIEAYASRLTSAVARGLENTSAIGAGLTFSEGVGRGLQHWLEKELAQIGEYQVTEIKIESIEDKEARFYLHSLTTLNGKPTLGFGEEVSGFPVAWVGTGDFWFGAADLNVTLALRNALKRAIHSTQNESSATHPLDSSADLLTSSTKLQYNSATHPLDSSSITLTEKETLLVSIPAHEGGIQPATIKKAIQIFEQNSKQLVVHKLEIDPAISRSRAEVFAVGFREEGAN